MKLALAAVMSIAGAVAAGAQTEAHEPAHAAPGLEQAWSPGATAPGAAGPSVGALAILGSGGAEEAGGAEDAQPLPRGAGILFVDDDAPTGGDGSSWEAAFRFLRDALDAAAADPGVGEVRIAQGVYRPDLGATGSPGDRALRFEVPSALSITGGFAGLGAPDPDAWDPEAFRTTLSGDLLGNDVPDDPAQRTDNSRLVVYALNGCAVAGLTVAHGNNDANTVLPSGMRGGSATIVHRCVFRFNRGENPDPEYWFARAGALLMFSGEVSECLFEDNASHGFAGALQIWPDPGVVSRCRFIRNRASFGGAIARIINETTFGLTVDNCEFIGNEAYGPVSWDFGGAFGGTGAVFRNCTFFGNRCPTGEGGAVANLNWGSTLINCILWDNSDSSGTGAYGQVRHFPSPVTMHLTLRNCCIQGWGPDYETVFTYNSEPPVGVFGDDPRFVDPIGPDGVAGTGDEDLRLAAGSPCIDGGDADGIAFAEDLLGLPRFVDDPTAPDHSSGFLDIGAYEYQEDCDGNGAIDSVDLLGDPGLDCDGNGVIDSCEFRDCDGDGVNDRCEIASGAEQDCNGNGILDSCDIASGVSLDGDGDGVPDECEAAVLYVKHDAAGAGDGSSWVDAFTDLVPALEAAERRIAHTEIRVAEGTYRPGNGAMSGKEATYRMASHTTIIGGYSGAAPEGPDEPDPAAHPTILSGDVFGDDLPGFGNIDDNSWHVVSGGAKGAILDGFVIRDGVAKYGYAGLVFYTANLSTAHQWGSGVRIQGEDVTLTRCIIEANRGLVLHSAFASDLLLAGCLIRDNPGASDTTTHVVQHVGQIAELRVIGCTLRNNGRFSEAALYIDRSGAEIVGCQFRGNGAAVIAGFLRNSLMANNVFAFNGTWALHLIHGSSVSIALTNNTIAGNGYGLRVISGASHAVSNNILWANGDGSYADQVMIPSGLNFRYNIVQDWESGPGIGVGNTGADPRFVDLLGPDGLPGTGDEDLRVRPGSPAIDSADATRMPADVFDLDGDGDIEEPIPFDLDGLDRFIDDPNTPDSGVPLPGLAALDRGAFEFDPGAWTCPGDLNLDFVVDCSDLNIVLSGFGCADPPGGCLGDIDGDGDTDTTDLNIILSVFGTICPN